MLRTYLRPAFSSLLILTLITGGLYTMAVTGFAQLLFPEEANGSLVHRDQVVVGSSLIGQSFTSADYFWGRPSATGTLPYNGLASGGANKSPNSEELKAVINERIDLLVKAGGAATQIPVDLVTASASGLDPDISPAAAYYQAERIAKARGLHIDQVKSLIEKHTKQRQLGFLGEPRVNVLELNLELDRY